MMSPIQEKLDQFQRLFRRHAVEFTLEALFIPAAAFFLAAALVDYNLWRWRFWELPLLRWLALLLFVAVLILELIKFQKLFHRIPNSRIETFNTLRTMNLSDAFHRVYPLRSSVSQNQNNDPKRLELYLPPSLESALDFLENPPPTSSRQLCEAVITQTENEMQNFKPADWLQTERFWRSRWYFRGMAFALLFLLGALAVHSEENATVAVHRFALPWAETSWKIDFRPQWRSIPNEIVSGETFEAEISLEKEAFFVEVSLWQSENATQPFKIFRVTPVWGRYRIRIPNITSTFFISISLPGETFSSSRRLVRVRTKPQLRNAILRVQPPLILRQPASESGWEISGLTGSRVGIMIVADRPLKSARIRFSNSTYVPGEPVIRNGRTNERVFKFRFELLQDCNYFLEMTDSDGLTTRLEEHALRVLEDLSPTVICTAPQSPRFILPGAKIRLTLEGQDDFGLQSLGFRWVPESPINVHALKQNQKILSGSDSDPDSSSVSSESPVQSPVQALAQLSSGSSSSPSEFEVSSGFSSTSESPQRLMEQEFMAPRSRDGTLKWMGFMVWDADSVPETDFDSEGEVRSDSQSDSAESLISVETLESLPFSHRVTYDWDLTSVPLESGMRLHLEPIGMDANGQRSFGNACFFYVTTPEEMRQKTFRQWVGITQEMRRVGKQLLAARRELTGGVTPENVRKISEILTQTLSEMDRLLNPTLSDALPEMLDRLEQDLYENVDFPFYENISSKEQLYTLKNLRETIFKIQSEPLPALNREVVLLTKTLSAFDETKMVFESQNGGFAPDFPSANGLRISQKLDEILLLLDPLMKVWNREEHLDAMRLDFEHLSQRQTLLFTELRKELRSSLEFSSVEMRTRKPETFQKRMEEFWELRRDTELFLRQYAEILEPEKESGTKNGDETEKELKTENKEYLKVSNVFSSFPPLALCWLQEEERALRQFQSGQFWELQRSLLRLEALLVQVQNQWIHGCDGNAVREKLLIFQRMTASQEKILHLLEMMTEPEKVRMQSQTQVVPLTRNLRKTFRDCAQIQIGFRDHFMFSGDEMNLVRTIGGTNSVIPRALTPLWEALCENLQISSADFRTISESEAPPLELLQDQYTLQLQIFDQLAELAQIADGMPRELGNWSRNSQFENKIEDSKTKESGSPGDANSQSDSSTDDSLNSKNEADLDSEVGSLAELTPADIQILISMQQSVLDQTRALTENQDLAAEEKVAEVEYQMGQERKIAVSAELLGFGTHTNSSFDSLLAQMYQVVFLLEKQDLGAMTFSIQEEILYGLQASLKQEDAPENAEAQGPNGTERTTEDLSGNTDSEAPDSMEEATESELNSQEATNTDAKSDENSSLTDDENSEESEAYSETSRTEVLPQLQDSFWGELPLRQQEKLRQIPDEKPIPDYRQMLEFYYRNLRK